MILTKGICVVWDHTFFFFPLAKLHNDTADECLLMKKMNQQDPLGAA